MVEGNRPSLGEWQIARRRLLQGAGAAALLVGSAAPTRADEEYRLRISALANGRGPLVQMVDAFERKYPGSHVNFTVADLDPLQTTTRVQLASGTAPDIITVWPGNGNPLSMLQIAPDGYIASLQDQPFAVKIPSRFDVVTHYKGNLMFLPQQISTIGCLYNKRTWDQLKLDIPRTWNDFLATCETIKKAGKVPISLGNATPWITQLINYALVPGTVYLNDPTFDKQMQAKQTSFEKSGWRQAMEMYLDLNKRGYFNKDPNGTSYQAAMQMVASGDAAMSVLTSPSMPAIYAIAGNRDFAMFPLPSVNDPSKLLIPAAPGSGFGLNAHAKNAEAGLAFLNFLATPEEIKAYSDVSGLPSIFAADDVNSAPAFTEMLKLIHDGRSVLYMDINWPNARVQQAHFSGVQQLFAGSASVDQVLKQMDDAYYSG
jgi:raffinose/stachyose/melibiose transport system substrate-binding protein